jgi:hypothetical protein
MPGLTNRRRVHPGFSAVVVGNRSRFTSRVSAVSQVTETLGGLVVLSTHTLSNNCDVEFGAAGAFIIRAATEFTHAIQTLGTSRAIAARGARVFNRYARKGRHARHLPPVRNF